MAYTSAHEAAEPDPGRAVVSVDLEAREVDWEFRPGRATRAWGFNGRIPGPTIEARVGDVLEVRLTNRLVPAAPEEVPEGILRQMGAYQAMLQALYPGREARTAVLWTRTASLMPLPSALVMAALQRAPGGQDPTS